MCKLAVDVKATCAVFRPEMRGAERVDPVARLAMKDRPVQERTTRARVNANRGEAGQLAGLKSAARLVRVGVVHEPWLRRAGEAGRRRPGARRAQRSRSLAQHHVAADGDAVAARRRGAAPARLRQPTLLARSRERAADDGSDRQRAGAAGAGRARPLRGEPAPLRRAPRRGAPPLARRPGAVSRRASGDDARLVAVLRCALRTVDRRHGRADARRAALAGGARRADRAHARDRRAGAGRRALRRSCARARHCDEGRRARRPAGALGRRRAGGRRLPRTVRPRRGAAGQGPEPAGTHLLPLPFLACLRLPGIHAYPGLHVLARGVIFVDLALAQVAALGITVALLAGHAPGSGAAYWYALAFAVGGGLLFAVTRVRRPPIPQEAIIGIVYAVSAALTVLVVDRAPQGAERIKQLLVGSILTVTAGDVAGLA